MNRMHDAILNSLQKRTVNDFGAFYEIFTTRYYAHGLRARQSRKCTEFVASAHNVTRVRFNLYSDNTRILHNELKQWPKNEMISFDVGYLHSCARPITL